MAKGFAGGVWAFSRCTLLLLILTLCIPALCVPASLASAKTVSSAPADSAACTQAEPYRGPAHRDAPTKAWERGLERSIQGSLPESLAARLDAAVTPMLEHYPAVSVAVAVPGEGTWSVTRGVADLEKSVAATPKSTFQVASITKAFTAAVVLQLVEEERLDLAASVDRWFPEVPNAEHITVLHLLEHTSGLQSFNALPGPPAPETGYRTPEALVQLASAHPPHFCPGAAWSYTNTGYVMLGRIVEAVEKRPFAEVLERRLFQSLGLTQTRLRQPGDDPWTVVQGHVSREPLTASKGHENLEYATPYAAGALASTAPDLVTFWHAFLTGGVLPLATVQRSFQGLYPMQPLFPAPPGVTMYYGRGVQLTLAPSGADGPGPLLEHSGGITGFNATVAYVVDDDLYVAVLVNDKEIPAAAGLWALVRAVREHRAAPAQVSEAGAGAASPPASLPCITPQGSELTPPASLPRE